jgi:molybdopterin-containing oxidoreductase family iron-sulfur binding subunit
MNLINIATKSSGHGLAAGATGKTYWRSLNQLAGTQEFSEWVHREFPANASEMLDANSRRTVLKLMAASFGLAGLSACRRPVEHILPYSKGVEDMIPGHPYFYSTVMSMGGVTAGLLVESHDGRPTKIEGNPDHPASLGAATAMQQAAILGLYDPDRSSKVLESGKDSDWKSFEAAVKDLSLGDGSGLRFLSESVTSPSLLSLRADAAKKFPKSKWVEFEPVSRDNRRAGIEMAFGQTADYVPHLDKAKVIVALDADFLGLDLPSVLPTKQYSKGRKFDSEQDFEKANRLYAVESQFSLTGANADHRLRMRSGDVKQFAMELASAMGAVAGLNVAGSSDKRGKFLAAAVKDLKAAGRGGVVMAGVRQPAIVHAMAAAINQTLGSEAISYVKAEKIDSGVDALKALTTEMASGQVQTLVILGGNPAYTAPADLQFAVAVSKVANSIHLGLDDDETAAAVKWHIPEAHFLESWSDSATRSGVAAIQQPLISPMYDGKTAAEIVALLIDAKDKKAYDIVRNYWQNQWPAKDKEAAWRKALNDGVIASTKPQEPLKVSSDAKKLAGLMGAEAKPSGTGIEVAFYPSASAWDGRFANNGWMQEAPDPITKLVWGNAAMISPATARDQKLEDGDVIAISKGNYKLEAAVMVQPGHADNAISISLGYGRVRCGRVGKDVGYNANLIRTSDAYWFSDGFSISPVGRKIVHATTQEHGIPGDKSVNAEHLNDRPVFRETSLEEYKKQPKVIEEMSEVPELHSIYPEVSYTKGNQWGMAIDLASCTGCNACVVACQAENNIPVVGREQVMRGREMHWIRMDRYYTGPEDDPQLVEQPIPCMQCENAPCENVCPVAATTHSPEGLNDMAYNRCVGTRYCANNCPVKVRHFNFLNFHKHDAPEFAMAQNPDVTVRMRGVMEKCTYCVQRIQETKIKAKIEGRRPIKDGEIVTACQQTCPADAIVFGNINDPESRVSKMKKQERNYALLAELDIKPRTTYLAKLRNPNPELSA